MEKFIYQLSIPTQRQSPEFPMHANETSHYLKGLLRIATDDVEIANIEVLSQQLFKSASRTDKKTDQYQQDFEKELEKRAGKLKEQKIKYTFEVEDLRKELDRQTSLQKQIDVIGRYLFRTDSEEDESGECKIQIDYKSRMLDAGKNSEVPYNIRTLDSENLKALEKELNRVQNYFQGIDNANILAMSHSIKNELASREYELNTTLDYYSRDVPRVTLQKTGPGKNRVRSDCDITELRERLKQSQEEREKQRIAQENEIKARAQAKAQAHKEKLELERQMEKYSYRGPIVISGEIGEKADKSLPSMPPIPPLPKKSSKPSIVPPSELVEIDESLLEEIIVPEAGDQKKSPPPVPKKADDALGDEDIIYEATDADLDENPSNPSNTKRFIVYAGASLLIAGGIVAAGLAFKECREQKQKYTPLSPKNQQPASKQPTLDDIVKPEISVHVPAEKPAQEANIVSSQESTNSGKTTYAPTASTQDPKGKRGNYSAGAYTRQQKRKASIAQQIEKHEEMHAQIEQEVEQYVEALMRDTDFGKSPQLPKEFPQAPHETYNNNRPTTRSGEIHIAPSANKIKIDPPQYVPIREMFKPLPSIFDRPSAKEKLAPSNGKSIETPSVEYGKKIEAEKRSYVAELRAQVEQRVEHCKTIYQTDNLRECRVREINKSAEEKFKQQQALENLRERLGLRPRGFMMQEMEHPPRKMPHLRQ